jgi:hypothetical protein
MRTAAEQKADRKIGYLRLAVVTATTAVLVGLGMGIAYANAPSAGDHCSVRNATTHDAAGHIMWCNPTLSGSHEVVWQHARVS